MYTLRGYFLEKMKILEPQWIVEYEKSTFKVDFEIPQENGNGFFGTRMVRT